MYIQVCQRFLFKTGPCRTFVLVYIILGRRCLLLAGTWSHLWMSLWFRSKYVFSAMATCTSVTFWQIFRDKILNENGFCYLSFIRGGTCSGPKYGWNRVHLIQKVPQNMNEQEILTQTLFRFRNSSESLESDCKQWRLWADYTMRMLH